MRRFKIEDPITGMSTIVERDTPPTEDEGLQIIAQMYESGGQSAVPQGQQVAQAPVVAAPTGQAPVQTSVQPSGFGAIQAGQMQSFPQGASAQAPMDAVKQAMLARAAENTRLYSGDAAKPQYNVFGLPVSKGVMQGIATVGNVGATEGLLPTVGAIGGRFAGPVTGTGIGAAGGEYIQESLQDVQKGKGLAAFLPTKDKLIQTAKTGAIAAGTDLAFLGAGKALHWVGGKLDPFNRVASGVDKAIKASGGKYVDGKTFADAMRKDVATRGGDIGESTIKQVYAYADKAEKMGKIDLPTAWKIAKDARAAGQNAMGSMVETTANKATQTVINENMMGQIRDVAPQVGQAISKFGPLYDWFPKGAVAPELIKQAKRAIPMVAGFGGATVLAKLLGLGGGGGNTVSNYNSTGY